MLSLAVSCRELDAVVGTHRPCSRHVPAPLLHSGVSVAAKVQSAKHKRRSWPPPLDTCPCRSACVQVDTSHVLQRLSEWSGADANATLSDYVKRLQHLVETNPQAEQALLAFVANEIIELPREVLVFFITPPIARALGRAPPRKAKVH